MTIARKIANFPVANATAFETISVSDPGSIDAWAIRSDGKPVGAAWVDSVDDELFFHIVFVDGKLHGKAELLKSLIPPNAWITVPLDLVSGARYLTRYVGMVLRGTVQLKGKTMLVLQRV